MNDLSLHALDVAQNAVTAGAKCVRIAICDGEENRRTFCIEDDGCGMDEDFLRRVTSPFTTSRSTRKVGLGIPLLKMAAEMVGGAFCIESAPGRGTRLTATFDTGNIDCPPLGDMGGTMLLLIQQRPDIRFVYDRQAPAGRFTLDTDELRRELDGVPLDHPEVLAFVQQFVTDNEKELMEVR